MYLTEQYNIAKSKDGFSLVEVIIVGIIVSILVMMALVSFRGFYKGIEFENTVNEMVSFLRLIQTNAVSEWKGINLMVLPDENRLVVEGGDKEFQLPDDYSMESDVIKLSFGGMGDFDCVDVQDPSVGKSSCWIRIEKEFTEDEAKIELWGYGGHIKVESISLGRK